MDFNNHTLNGKLTSVKLFQPYSCTETFLAAFLD